MRSFLENILNSLKKFWTGMTRSEKIRLIVIAAAIIVLSVILALLLGRTKYAVIYDGNAAEAGRIVAELQDMGVEVKTQGSGIVLVPESQLSELSMSLAMSGFASEDYDTSFLQNMSGFGVTDADKKEYLRQLAQSNIRTFVNRMEKVDDCLVMLTLPEESTFASSKNDKEATLAVTLKLAAGQSLSAEEAETIRSIVSAGSGVKRENVFISDTTAKLYSMDEDPYSVGADLDMRIALKQQIENTLKTQAENFLYPVFGDKVRVSPSVTLNFDKNLSERIEFEPVVDDEGIAVSMQELFKATRYTNEAEGEPGTATNGMGTPEYPYDDELADNEVYKEWMREYNYEVTQTTTQIEKEQGYIARLSVSVLADSETIAEDMLPQIRSLVVNAIGVTNENLVTVASMPFSFTDSTMQDMLNTQNDIMRKMQMQQIIKYVIIAVIVLIIVIAILMIVRSILKAAEEKNLEGQVMLADGTGLNVDYLADGESIDEANQDIDLGAKSETIQQLERFIDKDPNAVAQLLRNWLSDD